MSFFEKTVYKVVEIPAGTRLPDLSGDMREGLAALQHNPYFQYLIQKFRLEKAGVQTALNQGFELSENQLRYLQAGVFWLGHLESEIARLTKGGTTTPTEAEPDVAAEFERVKQSLDLIG
jgi:hypothetical protein